MDWRGRAGTVGGAFLGGVLLLAALAKAAQPGAFAEQITLEGLDFLFSSTTVTLLALALETAVAVALLVGLRHSWVLALASFLVVLFLFLTGRNYWLVSQGLRDPSSSCGCFGSLIERTPGQAFWQDLFLLLPALLLSFWRRPRGRSFPWRRVALSLAAAGAVTLYAAGRPDLRDLQLASQVESQARPAQPGEVWAPTPGYRVLVDGTPSAGARVFQSETGVGLLLLAPELESALLLRPAGGSFETAATGDLESLGEGRLRLQAKAAQAGTFEMTDRGIRLRWQEREVVLEPLPEHDGSPAKSPRQ